jgi:hypothetical protein
LPVAEYNQFIRDAVNFEGNPFKDWGNEPMVAVNPVNPSQIAITSFAYGSLVTSGLGATRASLWYSTDGGADWGIRFPITQGPAPGQMVPNDQTIAYDSSGTLHMASLTYNVAGLNSTTAPSLNIFQGSTVDPNADGINGRPADLWQWGPNQVNLFKKSFNQADQPWITLGGSNVYVGYGAWDTSGLYLRVAASGDNGATFTADNNVNSNSAIATAENPGLRLATDKVGNVYSIFGLSDTPFQAPQTSHYRLNMSSDGGQTWKYSKVSSTKYGGLVIDDGLSLQPNKFGGVDALYGNITAIAADDAGQHVYAVYGKEDSTGVDRIWLAEFHPDGQGGLVERANPVALSVPGQRSALPSIAVTDNGTVFVMYDTFDGALFHVHLATSTDQGQTFSDQGLYDFTTTGIPYPYLAGNRLFGDYQFLTAVGNSVYGTFAARGNVSDPNTLIDTTDKIDPFFFTASTNSKAPPDLPFVSTSGNTAQVHGAQTTFGVVTSPLTASYNGFVNGDTATALSGSASVTTTATAGSAPGTYAISVGPGNLADANYQFTFVDGTLTVSPAPLSATGADFTATTGAPFMGAVAMFVNADPFGSIGGNGLGGGLAVQTGASATVSGSSVESNSALGGHAGGGGSTGQGLGGGVYDLGMVIFDVGTVFKKNHASTSNDDIFP